MEYDHDILEKLSEEEKKDNQDIDQMSGMFGKGHGRDHVVSG